MNPYEPILKEIADGFLETAEQKPNFSNNALMDATLIFQTVLMDKLFDFKPTLEDDENCGNDLRKLIIKYTGLDTVELVKNYKK